MSDIFRTEGEKRLTDIDSFLYRTQSQVKEKHFDIRWYLVHSLLRRLGFSPWGSM